MTTNPTTETIRHEVTDSSAFPETLGEFLEPIFGSEWQTVCCVADDARMGMKGVAAAEMAKLTEIENSAGQCYFSKAALRPGFPGKLDDWWAAGPLVLFDDVGKTKKGDTAAILAAFGQPSFIVATSKGSRQFGYILDKPVMDKREIAVLHRALTLGFYPADEKTGEYRDPGHQPPVQYARLPFGFNTKPARIIENDGKPWPVHLVSWNPERKFSFEAFRIALDKWWKQAESGTRSHMNTGAKGPADYEAAQAYLATDHRLMALDKLGKLNWGRITNGYIEMAECPWHEDHHGTPSVPGYNPGCVDTGNNGIKCHHSNHAGKGEIKDEHLDDYLRAELGDKDYEECVEKARRGRVNKWFGNSPIDENSAAPNEATLAAMGEELREHEEREARPTIKGRKGGAGQPGRVKAALAALAKLDDIYIRTDRLVKVMRTPRSGGSYAVRIVEIDAGGMKTELARAAIWGNDKIDPKDGSATFIETAPDDDIVRAVMSSTADLSKFRPLDGLIRTPFMRSDATVAQTGDAGYDAATGLYIDTGGVKYPEVKDEECTKADALRALDTLCSPIREYKFDNATSKAVAVAALLMPLVRPAVPLVPGIAIDAPVRGTGKTMLMALPGILATGEEVAPLAQTQTPAELDKKFETAYLHGNQIVAIDNVEGAGWGSPVICSVITSPRLVFRPLQTSSQCEVTNKASLYITGNNLSFPTDTSRRFLVCRINPGVERPDAVKFSGKPKIETARDRANLVHAGLTIMRAYAVAGSPAQNGQGLGSFDEFAALVRDALMWLGLPDVVSSTDRASSSEFANPELVDVLKAWEAYDDAVPFEVSYTAKSLAELANAKAADDGRALDPDLHAAFSAVCPKGITAQTVGIWLNQNKDKWAGGLSFTLAGENNHKVRGWRLQTQAQAAFANAPAAGAEGFIETDD